MNAQYNKVFGFARAVSAGFCAPDSFEADDRVFQSRSIVPDASGTPRG
jgi:hypothetical protein